MWMPWVEDRANKQAMSLWKKQKKFALQLAAAVPSFKLGPDDLEAVQFMLWNAGVDVAGFDVGGWSNAGALECLHEGFARRDRARARFLPEKETFPESFESPALPGMRVHVLGPPRDPDFTRRRHRHRSLP